MKYIYILVATMMLTLSGCASSQAEMNHSQIMYEKQIAAIQNIKPVPIFQMRAKPNETIEFKGVETFSVYAPSESANKIPEYKAPLNQNVEMAKILVPAATGVMGGWFSTLVSIVRSTQGPADKDVASQGITSMTVTNPFATTSTTPTQ